MNSIPFLSNYLEMGNQEYHRGFESSDVLSLVYLFNFVLCIEVTVCVCVCVYQPLSPVIDKSSSYVKYTSKIHCYLTFSPLYPFSYEEYKGII